ncbi:MAG: VPS10 domain-containing protein [Flavobacteriaceae bacterium]
MKVFLPNFLLFFLILSTVPQAFAQEKAKSPYDGLAFRNLGPALTSGRIADIAIHPANENTWYVAVGSGGVWKTTNSATTWKPIFDKQASYSIGCITIDPNNPRTLWVGTGENVGGRHVGFGDGIYVSHDDGKTWKSKGLDKSEHISKIIVHPGNSNILWVAAQGPLWSAGGERGVYKSTDGGESWKKTLAGDNEWTGATDLLIDPRDPDVLYAATWQRHRNVAALVGGGPGTALYKSTDGGENWTKLTQGIPKERLGKIGLAMSHFNPDVIYAAIEMERRKGGVFMSKNGGQSWAKMSNTVSGGTGPHYYQELYASPHKDGRLYLMNNYVKISEDHGKTFENMNEKGKHVDSHAMGFKASDPNYVLFGTDGGLYESFDHTKSWKYVSNLPVTQYYKVAVDDAAPFYHIYGGTQDNGSHGGPSRTRKLGGIYNSDWWITLSADGHQSATEPGNPDITYGEFQQGVLWRVDQTTREAVYIQPQPGLNDPAERWNWDAPILVSPHKPTRLYFASQRVWKSENRGDSWQSVSEDLTRDQERLALPIMGAQQSWDNAWDVLAMSTYNTITSLAESPVQEGLLYAGTDDGILQVSEDGGANWRKLELSNVRGLPSTPFVNDVRADLYDANTVYLVLDNHKYGDFKPYLLKSTDKGRTWTSINGNLPKTLLTWRLVQDHVDRNLMFAATEFGVYMTKNGGGSWTQLKGGMPTISIRDITIQRRENDLVAASFGRGFYVLDDISPLRDITDATKQQEATLFDVKPAYWYVPKGEIYGQGNNEYKAPNPAFGAVFTYYLKDSIPTLASTRKLAEKGKTSVPFPGWDSLEEEKTQQKPAILLTVKDSDGKVVKVVKGSNKKGFNRVNWDLSVADRSGEVLNPPKGGEDYFRLNIIATPGDYTVTMEKWVDGRQQQLGAPKSFKVIPLTKGALEGASYEEITAFRKSHEAFQQDLKATQTVLKESKKKIDAMQRALQKASAPSDQLTQKIYETRSKILNLDKQLNGSKAKAEVGEKNAPSPTRAEFIGKAALASSTYGPTEMHKSTLNVAKSQLKTIKASLKSIVDSDFPGLEADLRSAGAPWIETQGLINN